MVTLVGVAYRGKIALDDITVEFKVESLESSSGMGFGVREVVTLKGQISESERVRLERASNFCPVGQAMSKGSIEFEDEVRWSSGETAPASPMPGDLQPLAGNIPAIPEGTVSGMYLLDTKEHDESGAMTSEGEAKISIRCGNLTRPSRWIVLGGHSTDGMVPGPFPLAHSGWLSSTALWSARTGRPHSGIIHACQSRRRGVISGQRGRGFGWIPTGSAPYHRTWNVQRDTAEHHPGGAAS